MIKIKKHNSRPIVKAKDMKIGDVGYITYNQKQHLVLRTFDRLVALDEPIFVWDNPSRLDYEVELVDIEITVK